MDDGMVPATGVVVFCMDVPRISSFYRATLNLQAVEEESGHHRLAGRGIELVVHAAKRRIADRFPPAEPLEVRDGAAFKPAFVVDDLDTVRAAAEATGGRLKPAEQAWRIRGFLVLDGFDPEGNVVQFKQTLRDA